MKLTLCFALTAAAAIAQATTQTPLGQIRAASPNPAVLVFLPCTTPGCIPLRLANLDPSVAIEVSGAQATIKAVAPQTAAQIPTREVFDVTTATQAAYALQAFNLATLEVYRNGLMMRPPQTSSVAGGVTTWSGPDYSVTGQTVTFTAAQTPLQGDVVIFKYLRP